MSESERRACQSCQSEFTIEPEDFAFYAKIAVPAPTLCPDCRARRRYAWRNERTLYQRQCDLCGKTTVSIYSPDKPLKAYCTACWWGDDWSAYDYGRDFDFTRGFFEQFHELQLEVPRIALLNKNSINSEFTNHSIGNKNCYLCFGALESEDNLYCTNIYGGSRDCIDCYHIPTGGELLYECIDTERSYGCQYGILLEGSRDCYYSYDLRGCSDCLLSYGLRNKQYYIRNEPYSKEEYFKKVEELQLSSRASRERLYQQWLELLHTQASHRYAILDKSVNVTGNQTINSKNSAHCFDSDAVEDCKYLHLTVGIKDSYDAYHIANSELAYEAHGGSKLYNSQFCHLCYDNSFIQYCDTVHNSQNLFGCMGIKNGSFSILNKRYPEEEYHSLRERIIAHMKERGEYGEFFPAEFAPIGYNETQGQVYLPLERAEVEARGWNWSETLPGTFGKETMASDQVPDTIEDVPDSIVNEVLACSECQRDYTIVAPELQLYRRGKIPVPLLCPDCRYRRKIALRPPRKLWERTCTCTEADHGHDTACPNEFETAYAPDRPELIYCDSCYEKELV